MFLIESPFRSMTHYWRDTTLYILLTMLVVQHMPTGSGLRHWLCSLLRIRERQGDDHAIFGGTRVCEDATCHFFCLRGVADLWTKMGQNQCMSPGCVSDASCLLRSHMCVSACQGQIGGIVVH